jgi:hypothetical protein
MTATLSRELNLMVNPSSLSIENLVGYITIGGAVCAAIGSGTSLAVDFMRRRVRAKASEYAASNDFRMLREDMLESRDVFSKFLVEYREDHSRIQSNHLDMCQRVARLEAKTNV